MERFRPEVVQPQLQVATQEPTSEFETLHVGGDPQLKSGISELAACSQFSGTVVVVQGEHTLFTGAFGSANRERDEPNTATTLFNLASVGKLFTAVGVLRLVDSGHLNLNETIHDVLPNFFPASIASATVNDLLTHRAGFSSSHKSVGEFLQEAGEWKNVDDEVDFIRRTESVDNVLFRRAIEHYSNSGYVILGKMIEARNPKRLEYFDYVQSEICARVGMTATGPLDYHQQPGQATGYRGRDGLAVGREDLLMYRGSPSGGCYSTAEDMARFVSGLLTHKLLSQTQTSHLLGTNGGEAPLGFQEIRANPIKHCWRDGNWRGSNNMVEVFPDHGIATVSLGNTGTLKARPDGSPSPDFDFARSLNYWMIKCYLAADVK